MVHLVSIQCDFKCPTILHKHMYLQHIYGALMAVQNFMRMLLIFHNSMNLAAHTLITRAFKLGSPKWLANSEIASYDLHIFSIKFFVWNSKPCDLISWRMYGKFKKTLKMESQNLHILQQKAIWFYIPLAGFLNLLVKNLSGGPLYEWNFSEDELISWILFPNCIVLKF